MSHKCTSCNQGNDKASKQVDSAKKTSRASYMLIQTITPAAWLLGYTMIKTCGLGFLFTCFYCVCFAQASSSSSYGVVLTKIESSDASIDTTRQLYCWTNAGDQLSVYTVAEGVVSAATAYYFTVTHHGLYFKRKPLLAGQLMEDSLHIAFQDQTHTVVINNRDHFTLFPAYYCQFKQQVKVTHSVMALLNLLSDGIGDYPVSDAMPILNYTPLLAPHIRRASIITQRSQAALKDKWICKYFYNKRDQLDSVNARSKEEVRFSKKIHYHNHKAYSISTYLNIEDRQVTGRIISYGPQVSSLVKWEESYVEMGKNRETESSVTLIRHDLGMVRNLEPSNVEVLEMLKPVKIHNYSKKHID